MAGIERVVYLRGFVKRIREGAHLPAITIGGAARRRGAPGTGSGSRKRRTKSLKCDDPFQRPLTAALPQPETSPA
jgi:hypothetical protein